MKKVLVTGSTGYIGSVLTQYLADKGFDVVGYDAGFFKDGFLYDPPATQTIFKDARDMDESDLADVDAVVHLAGISNDPLKKMDAAGMYDPTRIYSRKIAEMCKKKGIKFIFASSCSIYGVGGQELLTEESKVHPQTGYSLNKLQIEKDLGKLSGKDFSPVALRFATAFGTSPRMRFDIVVNMLTGMAATSGKIVLNSDGTPWRPNVHVLDMCEAIRGAIEMDNKEGLLVLNVGDEENNMQIIQIAKIIQAALPGTELKFLTQNPELDKEGLIADRKVKSGVDTRDYRVSFAKIKQVMPGFRCEWPVERGVKDILEVFKRINLNEEIFKRRGFYRLQQLEYLHDNGYLSDELRWLKSA